MGDEEPEVQQENQVPRYTPTLILGLFIEDEYRKYMLCKDTNIMKLNDWLFLCVAGHSRQ